MNRTRTILGLCALMLPTAGCETLGRGHKDDPVERVAGRFEPKAPFEGARGRAEAERPRGAWSSDAADIEKSLTTRSADANW